MHLDHSDAVGVVPLGTAPATVHLHSRLNTWLQWIGQRQLQDEMRNIKLLGFSAPYIRESTGGFHNMGSIHHFHHIIIMKITHSNSKNYLKIKTLSVNNGSNHQWCPWYALTPEQKFGDKIFNSISLKEIAAFYLFILHYCISQCFKKWKFKHILHLLWNEFHNFRVQGQMY